MSFLRSIAFTLEHEGGDSDHPFDRGGATRWGISSAAHPDVDLAALTREGAIELYRARYWAKIQGDALPWPLCLVIFDWAVHAGVPAAVKGLQRRLGVPADGKLGPITLEVLGRVDQPRLLRELLRDRSAALLRIGFGDLSQRKFMAGWIGRVIELALEV